METGAFKASAISCAFALTLPFLVRMIRIASLRLFCRLCIGPGPTACPFASPQATWLALRCCHRSVLCETPLIFAYAFGLGVLAEDLKAPLSSSCVGRVSLDSGICSKSGNLNVSARLEEMDRRRSELVEVMANVKHANLQRWTRLSICDH